MGEVYRARDTKLGREVAIKVLPEAVAADAERMARFEREAQMLASLDHPNIGALYDFRHAVPEAGEIPEKGDSPVSASPRLGQSPFSGEIHFLVMQLVEGETLSERLARGRMSVEEAVPIFVQIAQALEAAHDRGIVHRDLKPANVKLTDGDRVKVLDFGLAKSFLDEEPTGATPTPTGPDATTLPATPSPPRSITGTAMLVGTPSYMSPEQARGKRVDKRTDIWAFGCVLYEALTGRKAYEGETIADTVSAIIHKEVDWDALPGDTPQEVRRLLERCLRKDLNKRARDIGDVRIELSEALTGPSVADARLMPNASQSGRRRGPLNLALGIAAGAVVAGVAMWFLMRTGPEPEMPVRRFEVMLPEDAPLATDPGGMALSPDGRLLVYSVQAEGLVRLHLRDLETGETRAMPGTENGHAPFFSPDGEWVGFFTSSKMKKASVRGGVALPLADVNEGRGGAWGPKGRIVYSRSLQEGLWMVSASGGIPEQITATSAKASHRWPSFLPGGESVIFAITPAGTGALGDARVAVLSLETGETKILFEGGGYPRYASSGHIVYAVPDALMAIPFDLKALSATGPARLVVYELSTNDLYGAAWYEMAEAGTLLYSQGVTKMGAERRLVWVSLDGREEPFGPPTGVALYPALSPDGSRLALSIVEESEREIHVLDLARDVVSKLTFDVSGIGARWFPDGETLVFSGRAKAGYDIYRKPASGASPQALILEGPDSYHPDDISRDAETLLFFRLNAETGRDILSVSLTEPGAVPTPLLSTPFNESCARLSPDEKWIAYQSDESGRYEIFVRSYPGMNGRWQISANGGREPLWAPDGSAIYFRNGRQVLAADVRTEPQFSVGAPRVLFQGNFYDVLGHDWDIHPDGTRFVMIKNAQATRSDALALKVVTNWFAELERLAPAGKGN